MKGLQQRLLYAILAGTALFTSVSSSIAYRLAFDRAIETGSATLETLLAAVEKTAAVGAYARDTVLLQEITDGVARNPLASEVRVLNSEGTLITSSRPTTESGKLDGDGLRVSRPLYSPLDKTEQVGQLIVVVDTTQLRSVARNQAMLLTAFIVGQTLLTAVLLYLLAARLVSLPIVRLAERLRTLKPGTGDRVVHPRLHRYDEIGTLISSTNDMLTTTEVALQGERKARNDVAKMEARYRRIFDSSSAGIFVVNDEGRLLNYNPATLRLLDIADADARHLNMADWLKRAFVDAANVQELVTQAIDTDEPVEADLRLAMPDRAERWVHCVLTATRLSEDFGTTTWESSYTPVTVEGVMYDITERKLAESAIRHRAEHDGLTGLANRETATATLQRLVLSADASGQSFTAMYIDLDGFKAINDTLGHKAGDQVLVMVAPRLRQTVRRYTDLVARIGGDEFLVALAGTGSTDSLLSEVANALVHSLCEPFVLDDGRVARIGASIGIACYPLHGSSLKSVLQAADAAMYEVKRTGKNSFAMAWLLASDHELLSD